MTLTISSYSGAESGLAHLFYGSTTSCSNDAGSIATGTAISLSNFTSGSTLYFYITDNAGNQSAVNTDTWEGSSYANSINRQHAESLISSFTSQNASSNSSTLGHSANAPIQPISSSATPDSYTPVDYQLAYQESLQKDVSLNPINVSYVQPVTSQATSLSPQLSLMARARLAAQKLAAQKQAVQTVRYDTSESSGTESRGSGGGTGLSQGASSAASQTTQAGSSEASSGQSSQSVNQSNTQIQTSGVGAARSSAAAGQGVILESREAGTGSSAPISGAQGQSGAKTPATTALPTVDLFAEEEAQDSEESDEESIAERE